MAEEAKQEGLTVKKADFSEWFHQVIEKAGVIDQRYPLQGFLAYPWHGFSIHSECMKILEEILDRTGHKKCYFPMLIPEKLLKVEEHHIEGFKDEVFWVTHAGSTPMSEKAALRPTSETVMYPMMKLWIRSYRDLPLKVHQSTTIYRYETKHTRPLMRDREILWNEAHTAHASMEEAKKQVVEGVEIYSELFERICVPVAFFKVMMGVFAGAEEAIEPYTVFPDGRSIEMGSVNNLGQKFSNAFDIKFLTKDGKEERVYQTCYGVTERLVAAIVAVHGDDKGLVLPPSVSKTKAVIVPIYNDETKKVVIDYCKKVMAALKGVKVEMDARQEYTPGWKFNHYELLGIPVRIEVGIKEAKAKQVTLVRRDIKKKIAVELKDCGKSLGKALGEMQTDMRAAANDYLKSSFGKAADMKELKDVLDKRGGFIRINWCGEKECADHIKSESGGGEILGPLYGKEEKPEGNCIHHCDRSSKYVVYVAKLY